MFDDASVPEEPKPIQSQTHDSEETIPQDIKVTRYLNMEDAPAVAPRGTGPLDYLLPWVIKLRVVGTASILQVEVTEAMVIGRTDKKNNSNADIDLEPFNAYYLGVSRKHAQVSARNSRIVIKDLESANGTFLNGGRLDPGKEYRLRHGDRLALGRLEMQVLFVVTPSSYEKHDTPFSEIEIPAIAKGQRVLIVDDDEKTAQHLSSVLTQAGFQTEIAYTVGEAFTLVDRHLPDVILLELMMPDMSGLELVHYVREHKGEKQVPMLAISGATGGYQMGQAVAAGADAYLTKPVGVDELLRVVDKMLKKDPV
jgi:CheY-like chemotaxis protein